MKQNWLTVRKQNKEETVENKATEFKIPEPLCRRRIWMLFVIAGVTFFSTIFLGIWKQQTVETIFLEIILDIVFLAVYLYALEHARLSGHLVLGKNNQFERAALFCGIACLTVSVSAVFPSYFALVFPAAVFLSTATTETLASVYVGYLSTMLCLTGGRSAVEMAAYLFLISFAVLLSSAFSKDEFFVPVSVIAVLGNELIISICFFLENESFGYWLIPYHMGIAFVTAVLLHKLREIFYPSWERVQQMACLTVVQDEYDLVLAMKEENEALYQHAQKVSQIAYQCAEYMQANAVLAMAAGFYYNLWMPGEEPSVSSAVTAMTKREFPWDVVQIIYEHDGQYALPSTMESAIVHMTEHVITAVEKARREGSIWDIKMIIYQTLNDESNKGSYDVCGVSMHQYLKIREFLVKKEGLF